MKPRRIFSMNKFLTTIIAFGLLSATDTAWALKLQTLTLNRHHRFYEGADKQFVGDPYDWSGVARTVDVGKWGAMISPSYYVSANHFHPATGEVFRFYYGNSTNGAFEERTVVSGQKVLGDGGTNSDLWIGKLNAPVSDAVAKYPMLRLPNTLSSYLGRTLHVFGRPTDNNVGTNSQSKIHMGFSKVSSVQADVGGSYFVWSTTGAPFGGDTALYAEGGDSGGSSFIVFNGVPTFLGTHYYPSMSSFAPDYIAQFNAIMSSNGEQVTVIDFNTIPAAPQNFLAGFATNGGASLQWSDIADTETGYEVERRAIDGSFAPLLMLPSNSVSCVDSTAVTSISYVYRLRATNASGGSAWVSNYVGRMRHALPYREPFENFAPNVTLPGFEGWVAGDAAAARVVTNAEPLDALLAYNEPVGYPLRHEAHARAAVYRETITNRVAAVTNAAVWSDMMVEFARRTLDLSPAPSGSACAVCVDSNGFLNVWHLDLVSGTNRWTALAWQTPNTTQWARVTLHLDYATIDPIHTTRYFRIYIDGAVQSNALAWSLNDGSGTPGGSWFAMAAPAREKLDEVVFAGEGAMDDLVIDTARPLIGVGPHGTPEWWLVDNGQTNQQSLAENELDDGDTDGYANWMEYAAGTNPTNSTSLLRLSGITAPGSGCWSIVIQTVSGRSYTLQATASLAAGEWTDAPFSLTPAGTPATQTVLATDATLTFYVETAGPSPFYRVRLAP